MHACKKHVPSPLTRWMPLCTPNSASDRYLAKGGTGVTNIEYPEMGVVAAVIALDVAETSLAGPVHIPPDSKHVFDMRVASDGRDTAIEAVFEGVSIRGLWMGSVKDVTFCSPSWA